MSVWAWAIILFIVGVVEFMINQYERVVSVRLKVGETVVFGLLNQYFDFFIHIFLFGMIIDFWDKVHKGVYDYGTLIPYAFYVHGCVAGTALALVVYKHRKKKTDAARRLELLEKARLKKKSLKEVSKGVTLTIQETQMDEFEREDLKDEAKAEARQRILEKVDKAVDQMVDQMVDPTEGGNGKSEEGVHDRDQSSGGNATEAGPDSPPTPGT
jgi:hypothetical protein